MATLNFDQIAALKKFKPIMEGAAAVLAMIDTNGEVENLVQAHSEAEARLAEKREEEKTVDARIAAAKKAELDAAESIQSVYASGDNARATATADALRIKEEAERTAESILDRAKAQALQAKKDAQAELPGIEQKIEDRRTDLADLDDACKAKAKELEELDAKKAAALEHIQLLLKGNA